MSQAAVPLMLLCLMLLLPLCCVPRVAVSDAVAPNDVAASGNAVIPSDVAVSDDDVVLSVVSGVW